MTTIFSFPVPIMRTLGLVLAMGLIGQFAVAQDEEGEIPAPEIVELVTSDGVQLNAHYYPGTKEKETVPVILLHAWDDSSDDMLDTAANLQRAFGYAVIVPDLRGHGASMRMRNGTEDLDRDRWRGTEVGAVIEDIEACKNFLIQQNNDGELNIDMLTIVADSESAILAAIWTVRDWSYAPLGSLKQGQDVKAMIMLNPERNFRGLNGNDAFRNPMFTGRSGAAFPIIVAADRSHSREGKNIYDNMMRGRRAMEGNKRLDYHRFEMEEQERVVKSRRQDDRFLDDIIGDFVEEHVFNRRHDFRWQDRRPK